MTDEVRPSDIEDLKAEDKNLHARITRNSDQSREDIQRILDKMDELQKSISQMTVPIAEMATQVSNNTKSLDTKDKRMWVIMIMIIAELIGLVFALYRGA